KLQVELAQLKYTLPRLAGQGLVLSRLGGGIGTRGPGETKLETDRRHVRNRIAEIEKNLTKIKNVRQLHLKNRIEGGKRLVSFIGYTNAGKSTLLNALTNAGVYAEDKLFATLDTTTRKLFLPSGKEALLTDTVGFIRKLPHQLVAAFRATLEEVVQADLLLHVIDAANPFYREQSAAVYKVLEELGVHEKKIITVFNTADKLPAGNLSVRLPREEPSVAVSAVSGAGLAELLDLIDKTLENFAVEEEFLVPYDQSAVAAHLHERAEVLAKKYTVGGVLLKVSGAPEILKAFAKYRR
ncbi:MAG: GTPase HflX, partial [Acidaminococcales bacterium]|nr:GTPase HflX [Acidaminococcales bacterium]